MNNRIKALLAGAAAVLLIGGGGTYALASGAVNLNGGMPTYGDLMVEPVGDIAWSDESAGRQAHVIADIAAWKIVPGDHIVGRQAISVTLDSSNMNARLAIGSSGLAGNLNAASQGVTGLYRILDKDGAVVFDWQGLGVASDMLVRKPSTTVSTTLPVVVLSSDDNDQVSDLTVEIQMDFASNAPNRVRTQAQATMLDMSVVLTQTA